MDEEKIPRRLACRGSWLRGSGTDPQEAFLCDLAMKAKMPKLLHCAENKPSLFLLLSS
jgi:hypothetical protein